MQGTWRINKQDVTVWVDRSSLPTSVVVESNGVMAEDASWLQPVREDKHINLVELDAELQDINFTLQWKAKTIYLRMDSACKYCLVLDILSGQTRVRTKLSLEMLIRSRLAPLREMDAEYELDIDVGLVKSHDYQADQLTRVPWQWL